MRSRTRRRIAAVSVAALAATAIAATAVPAGAGGEDRARAARTHTVLLKNIRYSPKTLTVRRGDTVVWRWRDGRIRHDVVSSRFRDSALKSSGTHSVRFRRRGRYPYICTVHQPSMDGLVIVR